MDRLINLLWRMDSQYMVNLYTVTLAYSWGVNPDKT